MFQSSPALSSGRYDGPAAEPRSLSGFNPRPPFRAGATPYADDHHVRPQVSILARPFERALPTEIAVLRNEQQFQSSPALSSGRYPCGAKYLEGIKAFQSSPALSSGRYSGSPTPGRPRACFNPRPPFRAGATDAPARPGARPGVSILARPFERALHAVSAGSVARATFQSSPALSSGRYRQLAHAVLIPQPFQSSPALSSGRYIRAGPDRPVQLEFQSSPALSSGRYSTTPKASSTAELRCCMREPTKNVTSFEASRPSSSPNLLLGQMVRVIAILPAFPDHSWSALTRPTAHRNQPPYSPHKPARISPSVRSSGTPAGCLLFPR